MGSDESPLPEDFFKTVHGFLSLPEAELLYTLASEVPTGGCIVEIGAYQGRSTIALALGVKEHGAAVFSIDHHPDCHIDGVTFGMSDNAAYYANLAQYGVGDIVRTINLPSEQVELCWRDPIDLLWIDGGHEYEQVKSDWDWWCRFTNTVAMHDTAGHHVGINRLVGEILASIEWERVKQVDAISIFKRIEEIPF